MKAQTPSEMLSKVKLMRHDLDKRAAGGFAVPGELMVYGEHLESIFAAWENRRPGTVEYAEEVKRYLDWIKRVDSELGR